MTRGQLPQRAGSLGLNGGGTATAVKQQITKQSVVLNRILTIKQDTVVMMDHVITTLTITLATNDNERHLS